MGEKPTVITGLDPRSLLKSHAAVLCLPFESFQNTFSNFLLGGGGKCGSDGSGDMRSTILSPSSPASSSRPDEGDEEEEGGRGYDCPGFGENVGLHQSLHSCKWVVQKETRTSDFLLLFTTECEFRWFRSPRATWPAQCPSHRWRPCGCCWCQ